MTKSLRSVKKHFLQLVSYPLYTWSQEGVYVYVTYVCAGACCDVSKTNPKNKCLVVSMMPILLITFSKASLLFTYHCIAPPTTVQDKVGGISLASQPPLMQKMRRGLVKCV